LAGLVQKMELSNVKSFCLALRRVFKEWK